MICSFHNNGYITNNAKSGVYKITNDYPIKLSFNVIYYKKESLDNGQLEVKESINDVIGEGIELYGPSLSFSCFDIKTTDKLRELLYDMDFKYEFVNPLFQDIVDIIGKDVIDLAQQRIERAYNNIPIHVDHEIHTVYTQDIEFYNNYVNEVIECIFEYINGNSLEILDSVQTCYVEMARAIQAYDVEQRELEPDRILNFGDIGFGHVYQGKYITTYLISKERMVDE